MCQQRTALDMIEAQKDHGGMSKAALLLHRKQCEDTEIMNKRINDIEQKLDEVNKKFDSLDLKIDEIKAMIRSSGSILNSLKEIFSNKVFLYILILIACSCLGLSVGDVSFLFTGA